MQYSMFDDEDGGDWQHEPDDWWHHDPSGHELHEEQTHEAYESVSFDGESAQAAMNARLRRTTRLTFFDDESGDEALQIEPDDYNLVTGMVARRGWPEFSKAKKFAGAWLGMVFKRGPLGLGYYRDIFKLDVNLATLLPTQ